LTDDRRKRLRQVREMHPLKEIVLNGQRLTPLAERRVKVPASG
jgi:hypothetical protein